MADKKKPYKLYTMCTHEKNLLYICKNPFQELSNTNDKN